MFFCAFLIERASTEVYYQKEAGVYDQSRIYWIQPGDQYVGDQVFYSFIGETGEMTNAQYIRSYRKTAKPMTYELWTLVVATTAGFVAQFIGYRGLHSSVLLAQLGSTLLMAGVRALLRAGRMNAEDNLLESMYIELGGDRMRDILPGCELDWFALRLTDLEGLVVVPKDTSEICDNSEISSAKSVQPSSRSISSTLCTPSLQSSPTLQVSPLSTDRNVGSMAIKRRARLAKLTSSPEINWKDLKVRTIARALQFAIERSMEVLISDAGLELPKDDQVFFWRILIRFGRTGKSLDTRDSFSLRLRKGGGSRWIADPEELEAVVGLWSWHETRRRLAEHKLSGRFARLIDDGSNEAEHMTQAEITYKTWIQRRTRSEKVPIPLNDFHRAHFVPFIWNDACSTASRALGVVLDASASTMCAQDIFISFLSDALERIKDIGGETDLQTSSASSLFLLRNTTIEKLADCFEESHLGTREEGYLCIVPELRRQSKLPTLSQDLPIVREQISRLISEKQWQEAQSLLEWVLENCKAEDKISAQMALGDLFLAAMRRKDDSIALDFAYNGCINMMNAGSHGIVGCNRLAAQISLIAHQIATDRNDTRRKERLLDAGLQWSLIRDDFSKSSLAICAKEGDAMLLRYLLTRGDAVVNDTHESRSALSWAAQLGHKEVVHLLLREEAVQIHHKDSEDMTALMHASEHGHLEIVSLLESRGAFSRINEVSRKEKLTALLLAVKNRHAPVVHRLLRYSGVLVDLEDSSGMSAILYACKNADEENAIALLGTRQVDIRREERRERLLPIHYAAQHNLLEVMRRLMEYGMDADTMCSPNGRRSWAGSASPIEIALKHGHTKMASQLIESGASVNPTHEHNPLFYASATGNLEAIELLLELGADINSLTESNEGISRCTPLWAAANGNHHTAVEILLRNGADVGLGRLIPLDPELHNTDGTKTVIYSKKGAVLPIVEAARHGNIRCLQLLKDHGARITEDVFDRDGRTSLMTLAIVSGNADAVDFLANHGLVIHQLDIDTAAEHGKFSVYKYLVRTGLTPEEKHLSRTASGKSVELLAYLLQRFPNAINDKQLLLKATEAPIIRFLIDNRAQRDCQNSEGVLPFQHYIRRFHRLNLRFNDVETEIFILLLGDLDINHRSKDGSTAMHFVAPIFNETMGKLANRLHADLGAVDNKGESPLFRILSCEEEDYTEVGHWSKPAEALLKAGADVNQYCNGRTVLHHLTSGPKWGQDQQYILKVFLKYGGDLSLRDSRGNTPYDLCTKADFRRWDPVVEILTERHGIEKLRNRVHEG